LRASPKLEMLSINCIFSTELAVKDFASAQHKGGWFELAQTVKAPKLLSHEISITFLNSFYKPSAVVHYVHPFLSHLPISSFSSQEFKTTETTFLCDEDLVCKQMSRNFPNQNLLDVNEIQIEMQQIHPRDCPWVGRLDLLIIIHFCINTNDNSHQGLHIRGDSASVYSIITHRDKRMHTKSIDFPSLP
jgi:hypothetical protein